MGARRTDHGTPGRPSQIAELEGATFGTEAVRTDLAWAAVDALETDGVDVSGASYSRRTIELRAGGE